MRPRQTPCLSLVLVALAGCANPSPTTDSILGAQALLRSGLVTTPATAGEKLAEAATGNEPDHSRPRPTNPALLAARARLQAIRTSTILGRSRALMHNSDFDKLKESMRGD